ncbi:hypothetical protein [Microbacterium hominis]|uniref:Polysaccharide biosynthesis protein C-terminal domain-containing protein n=1 Tax=Microbacterium hominis TaxID=162426 RepID=A0A7D4U8S7_9MICO|nr:hypothetical protein [Microbacterium hominis]QKJ20246.1 hypothetical protein HQM25_13350 [Microbacterium hominis]
MIIRALGGPSLRLADQVLWSLAFFVANTAALSELTVAAFAGLSVSTAVAFIVIAVVRAYSINAGVIVAVGVGVESTDSVSLRRGFGASVVGAIVTACTVGVWLTFSGDANAWVLGALALLVVAADLPRQLLIIAGDYRRSLAVSMVYLGLVSGLLAGGHHHLGLPILFGWCASLVVVMTLGTSLAVKSLASRQFQYPKTNEARRLAWALSLEAIYFGMAGQAGLLLLFAFEPDEATAGFRISYALVYAPAFSILQGLMPLLVRWMSRQAVRGNFGAVRRAVTQWALATTAVIASCGLVSFVWLPWFTSDVPLSAVLPFLVPVGFSIAAAQVLEVVVVARRLAGGTQGLHRQRTLLALLDIALQSVGVLTLGVDGLVYALIATSVIRAVLVAWYVGTLPRGFENHPDRGQG